jgi:hypothetical protein
MNEKDRNKLIEEIRGGTAEGVLEESEEYGTLIRRTPEQARKYNLAKNAEYRASFHTSKQRDHWCGLKE